MLSASLNKTFLFYSIASVVSALSLGRIGNGSLINKRITGLGREEGRKEGDVLSLFTEWNGKLYLRVHIPSSSGHARSRAHTLAWPVTLSAAGGEVDGVNLEI